MPTHSSKIVGRDEELNLLEQVLSSHTPEFLAVYGRRRVGKTFLIRRFFETKKVIFFDITGTKNGPLSEQIHHFTRQVSKVFYKGIPLKSGKNWDETFDLLTQAIETISPKQKVVLFLDEFPWMVTKNSRLLHILDYYWNQHWSKDKRIKLIICGSSASWIIDKIVNNKGGLHNRLTHTIHLEPFNLRDTKRFLNYLGMQLNNKQILQIYMITGGVPYYLTKLEKGLSATQNIEKLAFRRKSFFLEEFDNLFASLFDDPQACIQIVRTLAAHRYGIGQEALLKQLAKSLQGKGGVHKLKSLQEAGFIISFMPHFHKTKGIYYRVVDEYSLFYFQWIEPVKRTLLKKDLSSGYWEKHQTSAAWHSWAGYAFEAICYEHLPQIRKVLGLSPTAIPTTWRYTPRKGTNDHGAQIDLLFDRDDNSITICEIKYTDQPFTIDKHYAEKLKRKIETFKKITRTNKQIFLVMISASGLKKTIYSEEIIDGVVVLDDLFQKVA